MFCRKEVPAKSMTEINYESPIFGDTTDLPACGDCRYAFHKFVLPRKEEFHAFVTHYSTLEDE